MARARQARLHRHRFALFHAWLPLGGLALLLAMDRAWGLDLRLADALYAWQGHHWALKDAFTTEVVIHRIGRTLSLAGWCAAACAWAWCVRQPQVRAWRTPLAYLVLAVLLSTLLVAWVKAWSNMDCPWDLARYGGIRPFISLFDIRPLGLERGRCFPAAHAGAGYAWVALYYFLCVVRPAWRFRGLALGLGTGVLFGVSQQLRGAHFLSHDLWTLVICWTTCTALYRSLWPAGPVAPPAPRAAAR